MTNGLTPTFATLRSQVTTGLQHQPSGPPPTAVSFTIVNTMRCPVFWQNALGLMVTEAPSLSTTNEELLSIEITYRFDHNATIDSRQLLADLDLPDNNAEKKGILDALTRINTQPMNYTHRTFRYTVGIYRDDLERLGGLVYLNDVDLVVGFIDHQPTATHPFSPPGRRQRVSQPLGPDTGFHQRYLLVDNGDTIGRRWINTGYELIELKPVQDMSLEDGVYITTQSAGRPRPHTRFVDIDTAEKELGVYKTRPEAETFGSPEQRYREQFNAMERELKEQQYQNTSLKQELEREKQEYEREKQDLEAKRRRDEDRRRERDAELEAEAQRVKTETANREEMLKRERQQFEHERDLFRERQKFEYENASRHRKEQVDQTKTLYDLLKLSLQIASVGLSLYLLVKKNQK